MLTNLELLRTFVVAAESKNFTEAARRRHVTKSAISQQIKALEGQLDHRLFERVGRNSRLNESGLALVDSLRRGFDTIDQAVASLAAQQERVAGEVRIGAPGPFTRLWLRPRLAELLKKHDGLRISVGFGTPAELERRLVSRDLDLVILVRPVLLTGVVAKPIFSETFRAYASPAYLKQHGTPRTLAELQTHRFIVYDDELPIHAPWWRATFGRRAPFHGTVVCKTANLYEMRALAKLGVGIVVLPDYFAGEPAQRRAIVEVGRFTANRTKLAKNDILLAWRREATETARFRTVRDVLAADR